jgi:hypothetical protein
MACEARKYSSARFDEESWRYSMPIKRRGRWDLKIVSRKVYCFEDLLCDSPREQTSRGGISGYGLIVLAFICKRMRKRYPGRCESRIDQIGFTIVELATKRNHVKFQD